MLHLILIVLAVVFLVLGFVGTMSLVLAVALAVVCVIGALALSGRFGGGLRL